MQKRGGLIRMLSIEAKAIFKFYTTAEGEQKVKGVGCICAQVLTTSTGFRANYIIFPIQFQTSVDL